MRTYAGGYCTLISAGKNNYNDSFSCVYSNSFSNALSTEECDVCNHSISGFRSNSFSNASNAVSTEKSCLCKNTISGFRNNNFSNNFNNLSKEDVEI